ncbi:7179_t:CDS:2 [Cetraspora pellucida]|uniref:7179_t:CDS:1 n=1 Tax=Cetraspora pellucida TaxID=1433469 RepID=A0ACA9LK53_9GLOM|nr:7179_t:CDS:2 [Cetraspora pellucida]
MPSKSEKHSEDRFHHPKIYTPYRENKLSPLFRWRGSVIPKVLPQTIFITILAVTVTALYQYTDIKLSIKPTFISIIGFIVSLLLGYRTNTAYDRYWEGRRLWSTMVVSIRNLARCIWVNVKETEPKHLLEKKTAINLLLGFAVSVKHYLREEDGIDHPDLKPYITNIKSDLPAFHPLDKSNYKKKPSGFKKWFSRSISTSELGGDCDNIVNHNLPLEISFYLSSYIRQQKINNSTDDSTISIMYNNLCTLTDCLSSLERVLRSPIPLAYSIHLAQTTWLYCLSLPFQLVSDNGWITVLITFFVTLTLLGVEAIANEIENPFGEDENDLDLDDFCGILKLELVNIVAHKAPSMDDWVYSLENHPFETDNITATEAKHLNINEVRSILEEDNRRLSARSEKRSRNSTSDSDGSDTLNQNEISIHVDS